MKRYFFLSLFALVYISLQGVNPETKLLRDGGSGIGVISKYGTTFGFFMPETGGYLYTGLIVGEKSFWLHEAQTCTIDKQKNGWIVNVSDPMLGKGNFKMQVLPLTSSNGLIIEVSGVLCPEDLQFIWAYGGCSAKDQADEKTNFLQPEQCLYNVFSREINSFTVYYGPSMKLKVMMGVAPPETETRLSDAYKMKTPLDLWNSGKKTNAPVLSGKNAIKANEKYYFCIYRQNQEADYNYQMLQELFKKELTKIKTKENEEVNPHPGFGPDFHF